MEKQSFVSAIKNQGVKNLKTYGYPDVDSGNIMTDVIYSAFFEEMLKDAIGKMVIMMNGSRN